MTLDEFSDLRGPPKEEEEELDFCLPDRESSPKWPSPTMEGFAPKGQRFLLSFDQFYFFLTFSSSLFCLTFKKKINLF